VVAVSLPLVENGRIHPGDIVIETVAREYLTPLKEQGIDTLILGCTHYPLLTEIIAEIMGDSVTLVNSGAEGARSLADALERDGLLSGRASGGSRSFYVTDTVDGFSDAAGLFLRQNVEGDVKRVSLDAF
jgi:glutamate racemase